MPDKTVTLGNKEVKLGEIHTYTYPEEITQQDYQKLDAYIKCADYFRQWIESDAPQTLKDNPDLAWRKFMYYLSDMTKYGNPKNGVQVLEYATNLTWLKRDDDLDRYPFDRITMFDYFSSVFWYTSKVTIPESVGSSVTNRNGKLVKRIKNSIYKVFSIEYPDCFWEFMGTLIKGMTLSPKATVYWRITDNLLWVDGSFADSGSCMLSRDGSYRNGLRGLITAGAYAIQFFSDDMPRYRTDGLRKKYSNGIGRAYLIIDGSGFCVVNGYGNGVLASYSSMSKCTDKIAAILSDFTGINPSEIKFTPRPSGLMYVNDNGMCQYFPTDGAKDRGSFCLDITPDPDIDIDDYPEDDDDHVDCENCGGRIWVDDSWEHDGEYYCSSCYHDLFTRCDRCSEYVRSDSTTSVDGGHLTVCEGCIVYYNVCESCGEYYTDNNLTHVIENTGSEVQLCDDCLTDSYVRCDVCGTVNHVDNLSEVGDRLMCEDCNHEKSTDNA